MKKIRIISMVAAILVFVLAFLVVTSGFLTGNKNEDDGNKVSVVVAAQDIPQFTKLTEDMLVVENREPVEGMNTYSKVEDLVGKVVVSDIYTGEVILGNRVRDNTDTSLGMTSQIEPGMRAVTLELPSEQSLANNLKVGYYVDVVETAQFESPGDDAEAPPAGVGLDALLGEGKPNNSAVVHTRVGSGFSAIILQNIKVIALDKVIKFEGGEATDGDGNAVSTEYASVTLEVTPEDAVKLSLMKDMIGGVRLILRAYEDDEIVASPRGELLSAE